MSRRTSVRIVCDDPFILLSFVVHLLFSLTISPAQRSVRRCRRARRLLMFEREEMAGVTASLFLPRRRSLV